MSRLARSNKDWHQLIEVCAIFRALLADQDGLYDPADYNDRLLLGLRGMMSEAEFHILRGRMYEAVRNKARRGELYILSTCPRTRCLPGSSTAGFTWFVNCLATGGGSSAGLTPGNFVGYCFCS